MSNFAFLKAEWADLRDAASKAEALAHPDPRTACLYARRGLELAVHWLYKHDTSLRLPYQDNVSAAGLPTPKFSLDTITASILLIGPAFKCLPDSRQIA